ncbi:ABC transporter [Microbacterium sp. SS28]|uniref:ABC transporter n=1 Tax=Microbacterium sp. SS28 TaxID=2919948 RepID=UPI001FAB2A4C|nr:ABC transporter [Microbacterium sp. SS28]
MSDSKSTYGEPVDEPKPVDDDVVGRVNEGLADAEAAGREAVSGSEPEQEPAREQEPVAVEPEPAVAEPEPAEQSEAPVVAEASAPETSDDEITDAASYMAAYRAAGGGDETPAAAPESSVATHAYETPVEAPADAYVVAPSEPVAHSEPVAPVGSVAPQPIFVQAPEPPRARGNRAAAGAIGLLAALSFAVLYLGVWLGVGLLTDDIAPDGIVSALTTAVSSWVFWVPVVLFFIGFWLLGAIINRGRWGHWVIFGIFVGVISWFGYVVGLLFQAPFWMLTPTEGVELIRDNTFAPLAVGAFIIGRELTIWFGAWAAARGKRVTELNVEAQREYERTLEAGPQLYRA